MTSKTDFVDDLDFAVGAPSPEPLHGEIVPSFEELPPISAAPQKQLSAPRSGKEITPESPEAERALLYCISTYGRDVMTQAIASGVTVEWFNSPTRRSIWLCAVTVHKSDSQDFDGSSVMLELVRSGRGVSFAEFATATAGEGTSLQVGPAINTLGLFWQKRQFIVLGRILSEEGRSAGDPESALLEIKARIAALDFEKRKDDRTAWPTIVSAKRLCAAPPVTPGEIINGLIYEGGTMVISGASKSRKTYTMLALAQAVASGGEWLGLRTVAAPVLYGNFELQDFATQHRIDSICRATGSNPSPNLYVLNLRGRHVTLESLRRELPALIEKTKAKVVVLDPIYKISASSGIEENSNDGQAKFLSELEALVCATGAALILCHHFSKGTQSEKASIDRASGGGALARWPDVVMTLTEHEAEECVTAEFALRNFAPMKPFVLRWKHPIWVRDDALDPAKLKKPAGRREEHSSEKLLECLKDGSSNKEWKDISGLSDSTFRRKRDDLLLAKKVRESSACFYRF